MLLSTLSQHFQHHDVFYCWEFMSNGEILAGDEHGQLIVWNNEGEQLYRIPAHNGAISAIQQISSGVFATGGFDCTVKIWDLHRRSLNGPLLQHDDYVTALAVYGQYLVCAGMDCKLWVWDLETRKRVYWLQGHEDYPDQVIALDDGRIISGDFDGNIVIWGFDNQNGVQLLQGHSAHITYLDYVSPNQLLSCDFNGEVRLWNLNDKTCTLVLQDDRNNIHTAAIVDEHWLITGSYDGVVKLWDFLTGDMINEMRLSGMPTVQSIMPMTDGGFMTAVSSGEVSFWLPPNQQPKQQIASQQDTSTPNLDRNNNDAQFKPAHAGNPSDHNSGFLASSRLRTPLVAGQEVGNDIQSEGIFSDATGPVLNLDYQDVKKDLFKLYTNSDSHYTWWSQDNTQTDKPNTASCNPAPETS